MTKLDRRGALWFALVGLAWSPPAVAEPWRARIVPLGPGTNTSYIVGARPRWSVPLGSRNLARLPAALRSRFHGGRFWPMWQDGHGPIRAGTCILVPKGAPCANVAPESCVPRAAETAEGYCELDTRRGRLRLFRPAEGLGGILSIEPAPRPRRAIGIFGGELALLSVPRLRVLVTFETGQVCSHAIAWDTRVLFAVEDFLAGLPKVGAWDLDSGDRLQLRLESFPPGKMPGTFVGPNERGKERLVVLVGRGTRCPRVHDPMPLGQAELVRDLYPKYELAVVAASRRGRVVRLRYRGLLRCPRGFGLDSPVVAAQVEPPGGGVRRAVGICAGRGSCLWAHRRVLLGLWNLESLRLESAVVLRRADMDWKSGSRFPNFFASRSRGRVFLVPERGPGVWGGLLPMGFSVLWVRKVQTVRFVATKGR